MNEVSPLLAFALTALIIEITPGPNMTYLAALSLSNGARTGFAAVAGIALGIADLRRDRGVWARRRDRQLSAAVRAVALGRRGLSAVARLGELDSERETSPVAINGGNERPWLAFRRGLITNLLNPKAAVFYIAVLPEFIQADGRPLFAQTLLLSVVYVGIATLVHSGIVALAGALQTTVAGAGTRTSGRARHGAVRHRDLVRGDDRPLSLNSSDPEP